MADETKTPPVKQRDDQVKGPDSYGTEAAPTRDDNTSGSSGGSKGTQSYPVEGK